jgi:hypothetical protein
MSQVITWLIVYCIASAMVIVDVLNFIYGPDNFPTTLNIILGMLNGCWLVWYIDFSSLLDQWLGEDD